MYRYALTTVGSRSFMVCKLKEAVTGPDPDYEGEGVAPVIELEPAESAEFEFSSETDYGTEYEDFIVKEASARGYRYSVAEGIVTEHQVRSYYKSGAGSEVPVIRLMTYEAEDIEGLVQAFDDSAPVLNNARKIKARHLKDAYMDDVKWIDDVRMYYANLKDIYPEDISEDEWYNDVLDYWKEARVEREKNKADLENEELVLSEIEALSYSPSHNKSRSQLER